MKTLIIYYSLSGNTEKIANILADKLAADKEQVLKQSKRTGFFGVLRSLFQVLLNKPCLIEILEVDPSQYDLVIIGTPVWMMRLPPPIRALIYQQKPKFSKVAFFCTEGSSGGNAVLKSMAKLCEKTPIETLEIRESEIADFEQSRKLTDFLTNCQKAF